MKPVYYINRNLTVKSIPSTEARRKSPDFYDSYRDALVALKDVIAERVDKDVKKLIELEKEIAAISDKRVVEDAVITVE